MIENLLEIRKELKERKPDFIRQDTHKRKKLSIKWRKPKGIHSKIRHHFKGRRKMPSPGYKSPGKVKNLHSSGFKIINIASVENLKEIKKESEGIIISKNVGMEKKLKMLKMAKELDIRVLNLNVDEQIKKIEDIINLKRKVPKETNKEEAKKQESKKETKEIIAKENLTEKQAEEDRKEAEKREKDKILTRRV